MEKAKYSKKDFRDYLLSLEDYYAKEYLRLKDIKPFAAEPERRMSRLCGHIIQHFDDVDK